MPVADLSELPGLAQWAQRCGFASLWLGPLLLMPADSPVGPYSPESRFLLDPLYLPPLGRESPHGVSTQERVKAQREARAAAYLDADPDVIRSQDAYDTGAEARIRGLLRPRQIELAGQVYLRLAGRAGADEVELREAVVTSQALAHGLIARANRSLPIGLDMPVGVVPGGVDAVALGDWVLKEGALGAPPDYFNPNGQSWGIVGFDLGAFPDEDGGFPLIGALQTFAEAARGFRIDHAIGLQRLCVVPDRDEGIGTPVFVPQPRDRTLSQLAKIAEAGELTLVAEDLGAVPEGLREALLGAGLLLSKVLCFEQEAPITYPVASALSFGTHDTPTLRQLAGDCAEPADFGEAPARVAAHLQRAVGGMGIDRRFRAAAAELAGTGSADYFDEVLPKALQVLAAAPSMMPLISLRDLLGSCERLNLPGVPQGQRDNFFLPLFGRAQFRSLIGLDQIFDGC
ncbi:MAG: 4-alpha-glucanotransferase [Actinomycetota bacterium]|nr:4-alpha-glucanotransferase [Actinomycetota bacterium]